MDKIIIASTTQYGYLTDTYKYCIYTKEKYNLTYICFDEGLEKIDDENVNIIYVAKTGSLFKDLIKLNLCIVKQNYKINPKVIFAVYNPLIFICRLLNLNSRMILDIRTGSVDKNNKKRKKANRKINFNSRFFKEVSVISDSLADKLKIKNYKLLPLGSDNCDLVTKNTKKMDLIYVGVLSNRDIIQTIKAFNKFYLDYSNRIECSYKIIGYFSNEDSAEAIEFNKIIHESTNVEFFGRKKHYEVMDYMKTSNIGISYIPINEYYNVQPPTKTFEYISHGLITIGTNTFENARIINGVNGVLCEDNEQSFYDALVSVYNNIDNYSSEKIKNSISEHSWRKIVEDIFINIIERK